jgi:hypothetical protein
MRNGQKLILTIIVILGGFFILNLENYISRCSVDPTNLSEASDLNSSGSIANVGCSSHYFQIFYGKWKVTRFIPGGRFSKPDEASCYVESIIEISDKSINIDDVTVISEPEYFCVLVKTEDHQLFGKYFSPDEPADVIDLDNPYFAYIYLNNVLNIRDNPANDILRYMNGFYVKDSETLILDCSFGLLEMRRLSYPNDYKARIGGYNV